MIVCTPRNIAPDPRVILIYILGNLQQPHHENLTGTRGAYKTYSTTGYNKYKSWEPKVAERK